MNISRFVRNYMMLTEEDSGGGFGGGVAAPAPTGGDEPQVSPGDKQVMEFQAPAFPDDVLPEAPGIEKKPDEKPTEPEKKEEKKPDEKGEKKPEPVKQLRDELQRVKSERDELKQKFENHPKVLELDAALKLKVEEYETLKKTVSEMEERLTMLDPSVSEPLLKLSKDFEADAERAFEFIPQMEGHLKSMLEKFEKIPRGNRADYAKGLEEFETELAQIVGDRKVGAAMDLVRKASEFKASHAKMTSEIQQNAGKLSFEAKQKQWDSSRDLTVKHLSGAFEIPEDFRDANPYHPLNFVLDVRGSLSDQDKAEDAAYEKKVDSFISFAANGVSPKTASEWNALPPKDRAEKIQAAEQRRLESAAWVRQMAKRAAMYERIMPGLLSDYAKLREVAAKRSKGNPPDPTKGVGGRESDSGVQSVENFKAEVPDF